MDRMDKIDGVVYMCYDLLVPISNDRILATHGINMSLISFDGYMIATYDLILIPEYIDFDYMIDEDTAMYSSVNNYLIVHNNGKVGIIDYDGNIILPIEYSDIGFKSPYEIEALP